jgi:hypothetical protein
MNDAERAEIAYLCSARAVRERAHAMLALAERGKLANFSVDETALAGVASQVAAETRANHPDLAAIPYHSRWRHFAAGGVDRVRDFGRRLSGLDARQRLRAEFDLVITSVLLDAGSGPTWQFREPGRGGATGVTLGRSEGLAVASYHLFVAGGLSSAPAMSPLRADAECLRGVTEEGLSNAFQVTDDNSLVGVGGRAALLRRLGDVVATTPTYFRSPADEAEPPRVGHLADVLVAQAGASGALAAPAVLRAVLEALGPIWPGRQTLAGVNLGDVWPHPLVGLVPFHKLSQWLTYSLLEPLERAGVRITELDGLTGLAEYRNGGLFVDGGVVVPKHARVLTGPPHPVGSEIVVEWRALTVALLDRVAVEVRLLLGQDAQSLPLARVLEGGTWSTGRLLARKARPDSNPPIRVESDGTVF